MWALTRPGCVVIENRTCTLLRRDATLRKPLAAGHALWLSGLDRAVERVDRSHRLQPLDRAGANLVLLPAASGDKGVQASRARPRLVERFERKRRPGRVRAVVPPNLQPRALSLSRGNSRGAPRCRGAVAVGSGGGGVRASEAAVVEHPSRPEDPVGDHLEASVRGCAGAADGDDGAVGAGEGEGIVDVGAGALGVDRGGEDGGGREPRHAEHPREGVRELAPPEAVPTHAPLAARPADVVRALKEPAERRSEDARDGADLTEHALPHRLARLQEARLPVGRVVDEKRQLRRGGGGGGERASLPDIGAHGLLEEEVKARLENGQAQRAVVAVRRRDEYAVELVSPLLEQCLQRLVARDAVSGRKVAHRLDAPVQAASGAWIVGRIH
mmetsp:Transcript_44577/g.144788  ORF Transcript_44577/g.144788 Transcript_44577/m.144788 type:complete len:386 (-) Transcript_44577:175-1332(-)